MTCSRRDGARRVLGGWTFRGYRAGVLNLKKYRAARSEILAWARIAAPVSRMIMIRAKAACRSASSGQVILPPPIWALVSGSAIVDLASGPDAAKLKVTVESSSSLLVASGCEGEACRGLALEAWRNREA